MPTRLGVLAVLQNSSEQFVSKTSIVAAKMVQNTSLYHMDALERVDAAQSPSKGAT